MRVNPTTTDAILQEARLLCRVLLLMLATMRPRRMQDEYPGLRRATTFAGSFGVCTSVRATTWSKQSACVERWTACSSSLLSSTGTRPSFRAAQVPHVECPLSSPHRPPCHALPALRQRLLQGRAHCSLAGAKDLAHARLAALGDWRCLHEAPDPMPRQLEALPAGDMCEVPPRQSKCDAIDEVWGDRPIALAYVDVPGNVAKALALAHLELAFTVEANARESVPLLTADNATPLTPSQADKAAVRRLPAQPHSSPVPIGWQSPKSLTFYCRVEASIYERWQSASYAAHFDTTTPVNDAVWSDAHFHPLACAASAFGSASAPATSGPTLTAAVSSHPPPTADGNGTAALAAPSAHQPAQLRHPAPARRSPGELIFVPR
eukprot:6187613-Pleurochrysis_carterae.AAC.3